MILMKPGANQMDEFFPGGHVLELTCKIRGGGHRILFLDPPHRHAHVDRFDDHSDAKWLKRVLDAFLDLAGQAFLDLKPSRIRVDNAGNLAQSHDVPLRDVRDMCLAKKRDHMMLAHGINFNVLDNDHFLVIFLEHG